MSDYYIAACDYGTILNFYKYSMNSISEEKQEIIDDIDKIIQSLDTTENITSKTLIESVYDYYNISNIRDINNDISIIVEFMANIMDEYKFTDTEYAKNLPPEFLASSDDINDIMNRIHKINYIFNDVVNAQVEASKVSYEKTNRYIIHSSVASAIKEVSNKMRRRDIGQLSNRDIKDCSRRIRTMESDDRRQVFDIVRNAHEYAEKRLDKMNLSLWSNSRR